MLRAIEIDGKPMEYHLRFSRRRRTLGIAVYPGGQVAAIAPAGTTLEQIDEKIRRRAAWIWKQLDYFHIHAPLTPPRQYLPGETHLFLGRQHRLRLIQADRTQVTRTRGWIRVAGPAPENPEWVKSVLDRWYREAARDCFEGVVESWSQPFRLKGDPAPRIIVRTMAGRWGSLSPMGNMTLNARLIEVPLACIEYVILHELCHLVHNRHSPAFFALLRRHMPDWETRKQRLEKALL